MKSIDAIKKLEAVGFTTKRRGSRIALEKDWQRIVLNHPSELNANMTGRVRLLVRRNAE